MGWCEVQERKRRIVFDKNGYACCKAHPPEDYDLVVLKREDGREMFGWKQGNGWGGRHVTKEDNFVKWKRTSLHST